MKSEKKLSRTMPRVLACLLAVLCLPFTASAAVPLALVDGVAAEVTAADGEILLDAPADAQTAVLEIDLSQDPAPVKATVKTSFGILTLGEKLLAELRVSRPERSDPPVLRITLQKDPFRFELSMYGTAVKSFKNAALVMLPFTTVAAGPTEGIVGVDGSGRNIARSFYKDGFVHIRVTASGSYTSAVIPTDGRGSFGDIKSKWMEEAVSWLYVRGVAAGRPNGLFDPDAVVTRAEFVGMLVRAMGMTAEGDYGFTDVGKQKWYYEAAAEAKALGIVSGSGDGRMEPERSVTRQEMFAMTDRAMQCLGIKPDFMTMQFVVYDDWDLVQEYAREPIQTLSKLGIAAGKDSGKKISPLETSTRAEAAQLIYALLRFDGRS